MSASKERKIVAICGFQGSGKDTLASILIEEHGFKKLSFASVLKDAVSSIFGWDRDMLEGSTKESRLEREKIDIWWAAKLGIGDLTPRWVLQQIGTEVFRKHFNDKIWIYSLQRKIEMMPEQNIVITDCRFPNEIEVLKELGAYFIHISRGPLPDWFDPLRSGLIEAPPVLLHSSEWSWIPKTEFNLEIKNDSTIEALKEYIKF